MKSTLAALIAALPVEVANFRLAGFPVDTGFPADTPVPWYIKAVAYQWLYLHIPGLLLAARLDGTSLARFDNVFLFLGGYLDTALLFVACLTLVDWWMRRSRRRDRQLA